MSDLSTSLKEIFNERISSPFYGSLIVSWLLWNWKIPYVTFFIDQSRLGDTPNKIDYILKHCSYPLHLTLFPVLSAIVIIVGMPLITNGASWITEIYDTWRINKKNEVQGKRLITEAEQLQLRIEIQNQEEKYSKLIIKKDEEIIILKQQLEIALKQPKPKNTSSHPQVKKDESYISDLNTFFKDKVVQANFSKMVNYIQKDWAFDNNLPSEATQFCIGFSLIEPSGHGRFKLTEKGKFFLKEFIKKNPTQDLYDKQSQIIK